MTITQPWPWYVTGPALGAVAIGLLLYGGRALGVSASYRSMCAIVAPGRIDFFNIDWRRTGGWNLAFVCGLALGGFIAVRFLGAAELAPLSAGIRHDLAAMGVTSFTGFAPDRLASWDTVSLGGALALAGGGFLLGFGAMYAGGCTSGHGLLGLADLQFPSLVAVIAFIGGGALASRYLVPLLF